MDYVRPASERGQANLGWLDSKHSFSFGNYYDPKHMGFSVLRVINDDLVLGGAGFDTHGHRDMEIISYILEGQIDHSDSMGNHFIVPAGDIQRMSAGTGIRHSEFNASPTDDLRLLQIWIEPKSKGIKPSYEQVSVRQKGKITPLVTPDGRDGTLSINQDMTLSRLQLKANEELDIELTRATGYLHMLSGTALVGDRQLQKSDGLGLLDKDLLTIKAGNEKLEALWFDLPKAG